MICWACQQILSFAGIPHILHRPSGQSHSPSHYRNLQKSFLLHHSVCMCLLRLLRGSQKYWGTADWVSTTHHHQKPEKNMISNMQQCFGRKIQINGTTYQQDYYIIALNQGHRDQRFFQIFRYTSFYLKRIWSHWLIVIAILYPWATIFTTRTCI